MTEKYGKNGAAVEAFLAEVRAADVIKWRAFVEHAEPSTERRAARRAIHDAPLSASVRSAVYSATLEVIRSLDLRDEDLPDGKERMHVTTHVEGAVMGLALGNELSPEHRRAISEPFEATGFRSIETTAGD